MKTGGYWLIGDSKLPVGVNMSVDGCLSLYVSNAMNSRLVQGDPAWPEDADGLQPH